MSMVLREWILLLLFPLSVIAIEYWLWSIRILPRLAASAKVGWMANQNGGRIIQCIVVIRGFFIYLSGHWKRCIVQGGVLLLWFILLESFHISFLWADLYFLGLILALIFFDAKYLLLPDPAVYLLLWGGIIGALFLVTPQSLTAAVLGVVIIYLVMLFVYSLGWLFYRQAMMGRGDLKFAAAIGAWIGYEGSSYFLLLSSLIGIVWWLIAVLGCAKKRGISIPFGPSLGFSGIILYFIARFVVVY